MDQKGYFRQSEGDRWFERNRAAIEAVELPSGDPILVELLPVLAESDRGLKVLEIGCSDGRRLEWLRTHWDTECSGVDPSQLAVEQACARGIDARIATADALPFLEASFDVVIFGFCLFLCDRNDLSRIAAEADRVLRAEGWLLIRDFYSRTPRSREWHHLPPLRCYKMDYRELYAENPAYQVMSHVVRDHQSGRLTDVEDNWVATTLFRKKDKKDSGLSQFA